MSTDESSSGTNNQRDISLGTFSDDLVKPFLLESSNLRGRLVRLGPVLDEILNAHDYPKPVAHLMAETMTLALLLSSMLKYEGIFTLQTKGDGPVGMLVSDITSDGAMRGCASYDADRLETARQALAAMKSVEASQNHLAQYLGKGYIAFTVDQGNDSERYQGIVELNGASLVDCVQHYFKQSEQIGTGIKMAVGQREGKWRSSGIMLQTMPTNEEDQPHYQTNRDNIDEDAWRRAMIFLDSCTEDEFLSPELDPNALLHRLFNEEGVRVYTPKEIYHECRCSADRVENILKSMQVDDIEYLIQDGKITMTCEFCSKNYEYDPAPFLKQAKAGEKGKSDNDKND